MKVIEILIWNENPKQIDYFDFGPQRDFDCFVCLLVIRKQNVNVKIVLKFVVLLQQVKARIVD